MMYTVESVTPDGGGYWKVIVAGHNGQRSEFKRYRPGATRKEIFDLAQAWCDERNDDHEMDVRILNKLKGRQEPMKRGAPTKKYRRMSSITLGRIGR